MTRSEYKDLLKRIDSLKELDDRKKDKIGFIVLLVSVTITYLYIHSTKSEYTNIVDITFCSILFTMIVFSMLTILIFLVRVLLPENDIEKEIETLSGKIPKYFIFKEDVFTLKTSFKKAYDIKIKDVDYENDEVLVTKSFKGELIEDDLVLNFNEILENYKLNTSLN